MQGVEVNFFCVSASSVRLLTEPGQVERVSDLSYLRTKLFNQIVGGKACQSQPAARKGM